MEELDSPEVLDLTDQVVQTGLYPVFEGIYSNIFIGEWNGTKVALKVVRGVGTLYATRRRLHREKQVWSSLNHQNILPLFGYCEGFGEFGALISPWCVHGNVGRYIRQYSVSATQRVEWLCEIIEGVAYLHSRDPIVIHGDLKPLNVLIDDEGNARICDFGLVRSPLTEHTTTNHLGTLRYRARELVNTEDSAQGDDQGVITTASDLHAIGCIALELLFLRLPYAEHGTAEQVFMAIHRGTPPIKGIPITGPPPVPIKRLWKMLKSCWSKDPRSRPSALQLQEYMSIHKSAIVESFGEDTASTYPV
ncbi:kinase-like protein [Serendipita vermifera]|nr:kinase-like protein [Serendipita vermifera]